LHKNKKLLYETQRKAQFKTDLKKKLQCRYASRSCKGRPRSSKLQRHTDASVKKATGDATSVKISAGKQMQSKVNANAEHQNNCNGSSNWWYLVKGSTVSYRLVVNAMGKENFTAFKVTN
jgi:hypothetical protein